MIEIAEGLWDLGEYWPTWEMMDKNEEWEKFFDWVRRIVPKAYSGTMRDPEIHRDKLDDEVYCWHQDCGTLNGMLIVWSNMLPTEVRRRGRYNKIPLEAYHVYALDNLLYEHRTPKEVKKCDNRWFARSYVSREGWEPTP